MSSLCRTKSDELRAKIRTLRDRNAHVKDHLATVTAQANNASNRSKDDIDALHRLAKLIDCHLALSTEFREQCATVIGQCDVHGDLPDEWLQKRIGIMAQLIAFSDTILSNSNRFWEWARSLEDVTRTHPWLCFFSGMVGALVGGLLGGVKLHWATSACCKVAITGATPKALLLYVGGGLVLGVIAGVVLYKIYERWTTTPVKSVAAQMKELQKCMEEFKKDPAKYEAQLEQLQLDVNAFYGPLHGAAHAEGRCTNCLREDMAPCPHTGANARHEPTCAIQLYTCQHVLCHECAAAHRHRTSLAICGVCGASQRQPSNDGAAA